MHSRRLAEGWSQFRYALTTAQALGLHRDGSKLGLDTYSTEYRRRLWSYLVHADATCVMFPLLGQKSRWEVSGKRRVIERVTAQREVWLGGHELGMF